MDKETAAKQIAAITQALEKVTNDVKGYSSVIQDGTDGQNLESVGKVNQSYVDLVSGIRTLNRTVRGPMDMVISQLESIAFTGAVRALLEAGVFEALPLDGTGLSADVLAEKVKVEKELLIRLMRIAVPEIFVELGEHIYAHTPYSLIYLKAEGMFRLGAPAEYPTILIQLSEYFKAEGWKSPESYTNNPYTFTHRLNGKTKWDHVKSDPAYTSIFNQAMTAQGKATLYAVGIYPFKDELSKLSTTDDTVLVVDVGGGVGHVSKQIRKLVGDMKGRQILQDQPQVIADIKEDLGSIEKLPHNLFDPNPVKGALMYYIRRCLHDWNDETCVEILQNIAVSMTAESRILIAECILPESGVNIEGAWMDLIIMTFSGKERTLEQWRKIVDAAGLRIEKTYGLPGTHYGVVEAYLK